MKKFNFQEELKRLIESKQLVELNLNLEGKLGHGVGYIIDANEEYITFARVTNDATLEGVTICLTQGIESIETETNFTKELAKDITNDALYQEAIKNVEKVKKFSFLGFVSAFENTPAIVDISSENQNYTGRIIDHDDEMLVIDEYFAEDFGRFSRSYINPSIITSITVGGTWLKIIARSLSDKKSLITPVS